MKFTANDGLIEQLTKPEEDGIVRPRGLHMSHIYNDLWAKRFPKSSYVEPTTLDEMFKRDVIMEGGMCFEAAIERELKRRLSRGETALRPGPMQTPEGIWYSPDLIITDVEGNGVLGEIKYSGFSSRGAPADPKFDKWHCQMMAYCYNLNVSKARLIAFFFAGDYNRPIKPQLKVYDIEYTEQELAENWKMLMRHAMMRGWIVESPDGGLRVAESMLHV